MNIGKLLKKVRLDAGLTQRQVCGDRITRNMLSLIENGSARPSMETLQYLAKQLQKPVSFFLDENAVISPNQEVMQGARQAEPGEALEILARYRAPDPVFDREYYLLTALTCIDLARQAVSSGRLPYGMTLLEQAEKAGRRTPYYTPQMERERLILCYRCNPALADRLAKNLPDNTGELLLRAEAALQKEDPGRCHAILEAAEIRAEPWHRLKAEAYFAQKKYSEAASHYLLCGNYPPILEKLELCYKELGDYQKAYEYACLRRP